MYGAGMGMGMPGMMGVDPNNPSLVQQVGSSTSQTFALIQSIVQTFGGFAQMLDSTFMATQSSFFAMLGVAEQFTQLRGALGQVLGVFGLVSWLRRWWKGDRGNMSHDFKRFVSNPQSAPGSPGSPPAKPSKKPLFIFLLAVFGLPYLMHKLIRHLAARLPPPEQQLAPIDPSKLSFARAAHAFMTQDPVELGLAKGEIVAVFEYSGSYNGCRRRMVERANPGRERGLVPEGFRGSDKTKGGHSPSPYTQDGFVTISFLVFFLLCLLIIFPHLL